jgi:hypothetical protein
MTTQDKKHSCDWCKQNAHYKFEVKKKKKQGLVGIGLFWYACKDKRHRELLDELAKGGHGTVIPV